jgi:hypothetical protein
MVLLKNGQFKKFKKKPQINNNYRTDDSISSEPPKVAFSHPQSGIG